MADKDNEKKVNSGESGNEGFESSTSQASTLDKLRQAADNLTRANAQEKARRAEHDKRKAMAEKDAKDRMEAAEKQRVEHERLSKQASDAKQAEYDYAQSYRKKLLKDKENKEAEAKRLEAEIREAELKKEKADRANALAAALEAARREARERSERADSVLESVIKRAEDAEEAEPAVETAENAPVPELADSTEELPKESETENAPAPSDEATSDDATSNEDAAEEPEGTPVLETTEEEPKHDDAADEAVATDDATNEVPEAEDAPVTPDATEEKEAEPIAEDTEPEVSVTEPVDDGGVLELEFEAIEVIDDDEGEFEMAFDENGNLVIKSGRDDDDEGSDVPIVTVDSEEIAEETPAASEDDTVTADDFDAFTERYKEIFAKRRAEYAKNRKRIRDGVDLTADDFVIHDDIVAEIKAEGEKLDAFEKHLKAYYKNCIKAIDSFEEAAKAAKKTLKANRDDAEAPALVAGIIKIYGKILEIRCNALENFARVKAQDYVRKVRIALHDDINEYNDLVITYSAITGEQLTRMSTFLPESIAKGEAVAVIPVLSYEENYIQVYPDKDDDENATLIVPMLTSELLFGKYRVPHSKAGCARYRRRAKRATAKLQRGFDYLTKMINETNLAERRYENELKRLEIATPVSQRATDKYKEKVFRIRMKYGKQLTSISTVRAKSAFSKTKLRLLVSRFAVEREKLIVARDLLRETYRSGSYAQKKEAENMFVGAMYSYNVCAEFCSKVLKTPFDRIPSAIIEEVCRGECDITFPAVAYKRELVETVGDRSRVVSTSLNRDLTPDEEAYLEASGMVFGKSASVSGAEVFSDESAMVDRASAIAKVLVETLKKTADSVVTDYELDAYFKKSDKIIKYFKRTLKRSEKAISRAFDENGVVTALVENLRVITNLIEVRRVNISLAMRMDKRDRARSNSRALYKNIEHYNGRAIDYMSIVGEQFTRITAMSSGVLKDSADSVKVPTITYKDNYIEVFPKNPLDPATYEKPVQRRGGAYTPLLMQHFRLTENRAVEASVVNTPFVFDVTVDDMPTISWWHPKGLFQHLTVLLQPIVAFIRRLRANVEIWFIDESLLFAKDGIKGRQDRNAKRRQNYEMKLAMINDEHHARLMALETVIDESDRHSTSYQKKLYKINTRYSRSVYKLKMRWMRDCPGRTETRMLLERLVLERERIVGISKVLIKYRNYGRITFTRNVLVKYKRMFLDAIVAHNETAKQLSERIGTSFSEIASSVADEIIRYGNVVKFPQIVCFREVIETIDGKSRTIGDRWHGFGLYTGTTGSSAGAENAPIMSVGAMGYSTDMGVPYLKADFNGMTMLGMTKGGVPLIGFATGSQGPGTAAMRAGTDSRIVNDSMPLNGLPFVEYPGVEGPVIPFQGIPMMLAGTDGSPVLESGLFGQNGPIIGAVNSTEPYSGVNSNAIDSDFVDAMDEAERVGISTETPVDISTKMIEERFQRSLRARSMTTIDGVRTWWKLVGSEINISWLRALTLRPRGFLRFLLPRTDEFVENVNMRVHPKEAQLLARIAKLGAIIDIECNRLYSAAKVGIRRSERKWSHWLHKDIPQYNELVGQYNSLLYDEEGRIVEGGEKPRNEWIEPLSLNIPDTIIHRLEDRPPRPPVFSYRNRVMVDENPSPFMTDDMLRPLFRYARDKLFSANPFRIIFVSLPRLVVMTLFGPKSEERRGRVGRALLAIILGIIFCVPLLLIKIVELICKLTAKIKGRDPESVNFARDLLMHVIRREIRRRSVRAYIRREENESRHYRIRYEKARNMKLYNKRVLMAIGLANDPIKYQTKMNKALRKYLSKNFRIDYNMRIRQLIFRAIRVDRNVYWIGCAIFAAMMAAVMCFAPDSAFLWKAVIMAFAWAVLPVILFAIKVVYDIAMLVTSILLLFIRNIWLIKYGAKDVEDNRYGLVLDCFITEQYKILVDCERFRQKPYSSKRKKQLIQEVNLYNKRCERFSDVLRIPINEIELSSLIEKLTSERAMLLTEIQNFLYARELIEQIDDLKAGQTLPDRDFVGIINTLNRTIDRLQNPGAPIPIDNQQANFLAGKIRELGTWIGNGTSPSAHQRYVFKRDLYTVIESIRLGGSLTDVEANEFCKNAFKIVDYLGGKQKRKIIRVVATDDMIVRLPNPEI